jgi:hypothetical protein
MHRAPRARMYLCGSRRRTARHDEFKIHVNILMHFAQLIFSTFHNPPSHFLRMRVRRRVLSFAPACSPHAVIQTVGVQIYSAVAPLRGATASTYYCALSGFNAASALNPKGKIPCRNPSIFATALPRVGHSWRQ